MDNVSLVLKKFNDKVRLMNQTGSKTLSLTSEEARNLHSEVFLLLAQISELAKTQETAVESAISISMDGGGF